MLVKTGTKKNTFNHNSDINCPIFEDLYDAAKFIISEK